MTHRSDDKRSALLTLLGVSTGHVNDLEVAWLKSVVSTPTGDDINGLWYDLFIQQGATALNWNDAAYEFLGDLGYTGALPDRWAQYWAAGGGGVGYEPGMMTYDGSTGYYSKAAVTTSGNLVTFVARFNRASFSGGSAEYISILPGTSNTERYNALVFSNDFGTAAYRGKLRMRVKNSAGTLICDVMSSTVLTDSDTHLVFFAFSGDAGTVVFRVDGVDEDDGTYASRVLTTGTLATGSAGTLTVGSFNGSNPFGGDIGYIGYRDAYLTNYSDFGTGDSPEELDETTWTEWGSQPLMWAADGKLDTNNSGSLGAFTKNGTITGPS